MNALNPVLIEHIVSFCDERTRMTLTVISQYLHCVVQRMGIDFSNLYQQRFGIQIDTQEQQQIKRMYLEQIDRETQLALEQRKQEKIAARRLRWRKSKRALQRLGSSLGILILFICIFVQSILIPIKLDGWINASWYFVGIPLYVFGSVVVISFTSNLILYCGFREEFGIYSYMFQYMKLTEKLNWSPRLGLSFLFTQMFCWSFLGFYLPYCFEGESWILTVIILFLLCASYLVLLIQCQWIFWLPNEHGNLNHFFLIILAICFCILFPIVVLLVLTLDSDAYLHKAFIPIYIFSGIGLFGFPTCYMLQLYIPPVMQWGFECKEDVPYLVCVGLSSCCVAGLVILSYFKHYQDISDFPPWTVVFLLYWIPEFICFIYLCSRLLSFEPIA